MVIQSIMIFTLGFFSASLIAVVLMPVVWSRSRHMTQREMTENLPMTQQEIAVSRDKLRAEHAIESRRLENQVETLKDTHARQKIDLNKQRISIKRMHREIAILTQGLSEKNSQINVLNQNFNRKLPSLEDKVERLMELLIESERENENLRRFGMHSGQELPD